MSSPVAPEATQDETQPPAALERAEERNLRLLAVHLIAVRVAWIFKTESVIMPAFLDAIDGQAWVRGTLPVLNNLGQSIPPLLLSDRLRRASQKKRMVAAATLLMGLPFLLLAFFWQWQGAERASWMPTAFLVLYTLFFATNGVNIVSFATLQGKLIRPERRGRLMGLAGTGGSILAILAAWFWLGPWLSLPDGGYARIFAFTGCGFALAGLLCLFVREPSSQSGAAREDAWSSLCGAGQLLRKDTGYRRLCIAAMLCLSAQLLFPHYQALGRQALGLTGAEMMFWVIAQNAGTGIFSSVLGRIADASGNRASLKWQAWLSAATPLLALLLAYVVPEFGRAWYSLAFLMLGITPVTLRTILNYALELTPPDDHPRAVAMLRLCMAGWLCLSPLLGVLIESPRVGFAPVFVLVSCLLLAGGFASSRVPDPRGLSESAS